MSEPSYEVYRPTRRPVPEPPAEPTADRPVERYDESGRPPAYDRRPRGVWGCGPLGGIPAPFVPGVICSVVWLISGGGYFWPMWVFLPVVLMMLGGGGRRGRRW